VRDNIAFGLRLRKVPKDEIERRVRRAASLLGIDQFLDRRPRALSGGQRQRVAMGRAIVREPAAFLMDEPLSNLDAKLRVQTRAEIMRLQQELRVTTLYVTHDQVEAMTMGDRVAVLRKGVLQQVDSPERLYDQPVNLFVGGFIGSPSMNLVQARLVRVGAASADARLRLEIGPRRLTLPDDVVRMRPELEQHVGRDVVVGIRPEDLSDARDVEHDDDATLDVTVDLVERLGAETLLHFTLPVPPVATDETKELQIDQAGEDLLARAETSDLVARLGARNPAEKGDRVRLVPDLTRVHFFDPDNGLAIATSADDRVLTAKGALR
jgi:multiple sugar transport system ATP-binding protein